MVFHTALLLIKEITLQQKEWPWAHFMCGRIKFTSLIMSPITLKQLVDKAVATFLKMFLQQGDIILQYLTKCFRRLYKCSINTQNMVFFP
jgi:hypothetical protein